MRGYLQRDGQSVVVYGDIPEAALVAAWFREQVPPEQELIFYDDGYTFDVPLRPGATAAEIEAAALAAG